MNRAACLTDAVSRPEAPGVVRHRQDQGFGGNGKTGAARLVARAGTPGDARSFREKRHPPAVFHKPKALFKERHISARAVTAVDRNHVH